MRAISRCWAMAGRMAAAVLLIGLAGCGQPADMSKTIRVARNIGGRPGFRNHFDLWKSTFEENNPGWQIELIDLGNVEGAAFYKSRIATGDLPEVVMTWALTNQLADGGHLVPLPDAYYEKFGIPLPPPYKGKRYTSQGGTQIQGIVINRKLWVKAGITGPPETWDDLMAALAKIKAKGIKPLVFGGKEWSASHPLLYAMATNMYDVEPDPAKPSWTKRKDAGEISFATDATARMTVEKMIYLLDNFIQKGALSTGYNEEQRQFYSGEFATWMMGCWIGGDIEPNKVEFEMEYWPIPSMTGRKPIFIETSRFQNGWAVTTSAKGEKLEKARAVLETFYDKEVYQAFLNAEAQFARAGKVPVSGPKSDWKPAQDLFDDMAANMKTYGVTPGFHIALDDMPPDIWVTSLSRVMQEMLCGTRDVGKLLKMLDDEWERARKGA